MPRSIAELREAAGGLDNLTDEEIVKASYPDYQRYYGSEDEYAKAIGYRGAWPGPGQSSTALGDAYQSPTDRPPVLQSASFESAGAMVFIAVISWVIYKKYIEESLPAKTPVRTGLVGAVFGAALTLSILPHQFRTKDTGNAVVGSLTLLLMYAAVGFCIGWAYRKWRPTEPRTPVENQSANAPIARNSIPPDSPVLAPLTPPAVLSQSAGGAPTEEDHWATALAELDEGNRRQGVWAKAFADSDGDDVKARVAYLKARVQQLAAPAADR